MRGHAGEAFDFCFTLGFRGRRDRNMGSRARRRRDLVTARFRVGYPQRKFSRRGKRGKATEV